MSQARAARPRGTGGVRDKFRLLTTVPAWAALVVVVGIAVILIQASLPEIRVSGLSFLTRQAWDPVVENFGALALIFGTVASSVLALLLAVPVGLGVAIFLAEPGLVRLRGAVGIGVELLAAIPSVVYGIWGLFILAPFLFLHVEKPLTAKLGWVPFLGGPARQTSLFTASVVLAVMVLPTLSAVARDVIRAVPWELREASMALGTTWWETMWRIVLPTARAGLAGAVSLALGRALGETIAVTMVIGNRPEIPTSIFAPAYTLASVIANEFAEATGVIYPSVLLEVGLVLLAVTLVVNVTATLLVRRTTAL